MKNNQASQFIYEKKDICLDNANLMLEETVFHSANGYLGVRACLEEGYPKDYDSIRGSYINGFYDFAEMKQQKSSAASVRRSRPCST